MVTEVAAVRVVIPLTAPAVVTLKALDVIENVPVEFPIAVLDVPEVLMLAVPPETVSPPVLVKSPAEVIVPDPVVEIFPEVVSVPAVLIDHVEPVIEVVPVALPIAVFPVPVPIFVTAAPDEFKLVVPVEVSVVNAPSAAVD